MECVCYRIQSLVCSPSTSLFALSAMGSLSQPPSIQGLGRTTMGLTSPHLPSQMAKPSEMLPMNRRVMSTATSSRYEPTPGELTIWDLAEQKIQVTVNYWLNNYWRFSIINCWIERSLAMYVLVTSLSRARVT